MTCLNLKQCFMLRKVMEHSSWTILHILPWSHCRGWALSCSRIHQPWLDCQEHIDLYLTLSQDICAESIEWKDGGLVLHKQMGSVRLDTQHPHFKFVLFSPRLLQDFFFQLGSYYETQSAPDDVTMGQAYHTAGAKPFDVLGSVLWYVINYTSQPLCCRREGLLPWFGICEVFQRHWSKTGQSLIDMDNMTLQNLFLIFFRGEGVGQKKKKKRKPIVVSV